MFLRFVVSLGLILSVGTKANATDSEQMNYRAKVTAIKQLLPRQNQDQIHYETQLELLTEPNDIGRCAVAKGSMVTANLSPGQNEDVSFLKPGVEIEVVCEFQRYTQEGETKEITFWTIWDYSPSIRYKNDSGLIVKRSSNRGAGSDNMPPHTCSGRLAENVTLEKVGLTTELLKQGVECVAGDFDGNGYFDFALFQPRAMSDSFAKALVLFFEGKKVKLVSELDRPPTQLCRAHFGCNCFGLNEHDGIQQDGGGEPDRSVVFLTSSGEWKWSSCGGCEAE